MISNRPTQAGRDKGASPRLHLRHSSLAPAPSTTQSSNNSKRQQHCPSNHSDDFGVAHNHLNPDSAPVRPYSKALAMQQLTYATSTRIAPIQQPLLQPQSHFESPPLACLLASLYLPSLLSTTKFPTSGLL